MKYSDLHVRSLVRMAGGVIYRDMPPVTDIRGHVSSVLLPSGKRMFLLEAGLYIVNFEEPCPFDINENVLTDIRQYELNLAGARLTLNTSPFCGVLEVFYDMQIEENSKIAMLGYEVVASKFALALE